MPLYPARLSNLVLKIRAPKGKGPHPVLLLLHGWTGDENGMWIFASRLPDKYLMISPRGLFESPMGGYAWHKHRSTAWPAVNEFRPAVETLIDMMHAGDGRQDAFADAVGASNSLRSALAQADFSRVSLLGFSQGAALAYSFALFFPECLHLLGGLAGFMPERVEELVAQQPLDGKHVFIAHGIQDEIVPIEKARQSVELLQRAGSEVTYCEQQAGHKLCAACFRALEGFFAQRS